MNMAEFRAWAAPRCEEVPYLPDAMPCLIWQGATINHGRDPRAVMRRGWPPVMVRREAWAILHPDKHLRRQDSARPVCECPLCVEPTHLRLCQSSEYRSVPKSAAAKLRMQAAARASRSKVKAPEIIVPMVRAAEGPAWKVTQDLGLSKDVVRDMRAGRWDRAAFGANPFSGLL